MQKHAKLANPPTSETKLHFMQFKQCLYKKKILQEKAWMKDNTSLSETYQDQNCWNCIGILEDRRTLELVL